MTPRILTGEEARKAFADLTKTPEQRRAEDAAAFAAIKDFIERMKARKI